MTDISKEAIALLNAKTCAKIDDGYTLGADEVAELLDVIKAQGVLINALEGAIRDADSVVTIEINPSNYDHDGVCLLNDQMVEAFSILTAALPQAKGEG